MKKKEKGFNKDVKMRH